MDSSRGLGPQLTLDVAGLAKDAWGLARSLVNYADDNLQPIARIPLQKFGVFVAADSRRITRGQDALLETRNKTLNFLKIVVGLSSRGIASDVAQDHSLTSAFLFAVACIPALKPNQTGTLIYEMILLGSAANDRILAPSSAVKQFVHSLCGYADLIQDHPGQLYTYLETAIINHLPGEAWAELWSMLETEILAELLHKIFESLLDIDHELITVEGSHCGLFIAALFCWLRQEDTTILIRGNRIFPTKGDANPRLCVNIIRNRDGISRWKIKKWRSLASLKPGQSQQQEEMLGRSELQSVEIGNSMTPLHSHYPLKSAKNQMLGSGVSEAQLEEIGHLAAALIDTAYDQGIIYQTIRSKSAVLSEICSVSFCNSYRTIIQEFGWETLERESEDPMVAVMKRTFERIREVGGYERGETDLQSLGSALQEFERDYYDSTGRKVVSHSDAFRDVAERAIHLATEALYFSLCMKFPKYPVYRPLTTHRLLGNALILGPLLCGVDGLPYWAFRAQAIQAMLQGVTDVDAEDLIVSSNGYSVCASALVNLEKNATEKRIASSFYVIPGPLRLDHEVSSFSRLVWKKGVSIKHSRQRVNQAVSLFNLGNFQGLDESEGNKHSDVRIEHLVGLDNDETMKDVLYVTTHIHRGSETVELPGIQQSLVFAPMITTDWPASIEAILFSTPVSTHSLAHSQEKTLAEWWRSQGWIDDLVWKWPGQEAQRKVPWLSRTRGNELLRFFEAGNLGRNGKLFIRQRSVPLMQCLKEAFETCKGDPEWAVLS